jgi:geranylgeranyl pyrophosphate synthase/predicted secreted hydrolase
MTFEATPGVGLLPADWPAPGHINLATHDLPHASSTMEWWYVNTHLTTVAGRRLSLFAAFFRVDVTEKGASERTFGHFLTWALIDVDGARYFPHSLVDRRSPEIALRDLDQGRGPRDDRLARALREVVAQGRVPLPDRLLESDAQVDLQRLDLNFDGNRFSKREDGSYDLELAGDGAREGCRLRFTLGKPVVRHGDDGIVRGVGGEEMFYYFSPRCCVEGSVLLDGAWIACAPGSGWFDHEFGERSSSSSDADSETRVAWHWLSAQLENGYDVSAYDLFDRDDASRRFGRWVIVVDPSGERHAYTDFALDPYDFWTSTKTFNEYPTRYRLLVPAAALSLDVHAALAGQEILTIISPPAFWEGVVTVAGEMNGMPVTGRGFVERSGLSVVDSTDDFLASVGRETRRAIDALLPTPLTRAQALPLIGGDRRGHFLDGVDLDQYSRTVLQPIRDIILRGGKAWRSYGVLACMDLVGGDSQRFAHWLALPELLHVGSLIIDDVQDGSDVRRGGPTCHKLYGEALAINAGCASYFLAQIPATTSGLPHALLVRIYESYFEAIRAAHAGQAMDIEGLTPLIPAVVESGDGELLERRVRAIHRLKSAAPAGALARMATLIGGGTDEQAEGVGSLFESFGVAFQIIDDVLNLRGFEQDRKRRGEDISAGKITAPVAKAMSRLSREERGMLASILASRPSDDAVIREAMSLVDGCGALDACELEARELVETAWKLLDPLVPDSHFKLRLRAFGWFVLDRYY